jgi:DNA-binding CsgD family transcriptional regulator
MISLRMLQSRYLSVMEATTKTDFRSQVIRFTRHLGFQTVNTMVVLDHSINNTEFQVIGNIPPGFEESHANADLGRRDPVMQHCKNTSIPIIWNQSTYVSNGEAPLWEEQAFYGIKTGIALAMHMPDSSHFFIGVDRDRILSESEKSMTRIVADLQLFAVHAQDAAFRLFAPQLRADVESPHLTARELEALRWTMDGKRAWEVGAALNISERTAVFHLQNAVRKLGCTNKHQAVLKAIRMKLLQ